MLNRRAALALPALLPASALAQSGPSTWAPSRPGRIIVPFTAGGATDVTARIIAERLSTVLGQNYVVDNRPGAGGNVGAELVAKADPDGHTLLMCTIGTASINQFLYPRLPFDPQRDFASVALVNQVTNAVVVHPSVQANSFQELLALARRQPGRLNYATPGNGTSGHMSGEYLKFRTQVDINHVPYRGTGALIPDLLGGRVEIAVDNLPAYIPHIREGRLRILAVTSRERWFAVPDAPTVQESGVPSFEAVAWFGMQAPARTPRPALDRLTAAVLEICAEPATIARFRELGATASPLGGADFDRFIAAENDKWREVVRVANIKLE
ncbi:Bug family tripartite tricarboxylate transporter substrate binding protein [Sediminicoccus rosea]|jgi:tripartite-type tricarboxylate transporter receptor subunit TctC|uniref:Tripartite tricarboxylate transporter substrate binding protein n=1 Tax=Sediminicoccus rosea TaxID=1225128 RepID=A0ABZ0PJS7_9PROT|nr:tripartite tricarboxylate transporter substrate binding protein [Sediminicoccus rosea]WPB85647.1 tripartite tricarboxylate transporter substrate binding protein [Sediminicoccus rosea]